MSELIIIAEIGENHLGDMGLAKKLIKQAAGSEADYVKFQSYKPETFRPQDPEYEWFKKVSLSDEAHFMLKDYSETCGIKFLSSPFSLERARFLCERLGLKEIKVASGVMLNFPLLDYLNKHAEIVFLSTGMATLKEIKTSLLHLKKIKKCYLMHCVTQYPCKDEEAGLSAINVLKKEFPDYGIGYSDHTIGYLASLAAVTLGAKVIEKHFTFDKNEKEGTDHIFSVNSCELKILVKEAKRIGLLLGKAAKAPTFGEKKIKKFIRNRFL